MMEASTTYNAGFYRDLEDTSYNSALRVLSVVFDVLEIKSVVDFGCGTGAWLRAAQEFGSVRALGIDGDWVKPEMLVCSKMEFRPMELEQPIRLSETFDLAISCEVGEHLSEARAEGFVADLCAAAPRVLFGAAIPEQGGSSHINEQWQSYWARKFMANGYTPIDIVRPQVAEYDDALPWYKNNTLLYVRNAEAAELYKKLVLENKYKLFLTDLVIPDMYDSLGLRKSISVAGEIPGKIIRSLRWRLRIGRM
jgi:cyclopropane fatty-acyl-phospholipid synthase-like methyltransferase